jgi:hypothetical protein
MTPQLAVPTDKGNGEEQNLSSSANASLPASASGILPRISRRPDRLDCLFLSLAFRWRYAGAVVLEAPQWELEKSVGSRFAHPIVSVFEPLVALRFWLFDEPTALIPAPDMEAIRGTVFVRPPLLRP